MINKMSNQTFGLIAAKWLIVAVGVFSSLILPVLTNTALLVIDVQQCFLSGGSLAVTDGEAVIPVINNIRRKYGNRIALTVFSQDWHCKNHVSFASQHDGYNAYDVITLQYDSEGKLCENNCNAAHFVNQTLWPDHCVINRTDAEFSPKILKKPGDLVVKKGYNSDVDSYSAFYDNGGFSKTELEDLLRKDGIDTVIVTGLALDFCVYYTSKDAKQIGFDVYTVVDASRPVNKENVPQILDSLRLKEHILADVENPKNSASYFQHRNTKKVLRFTKNKYEICAELTGADRLSTFENSSIHKFIVYVIVDLSTKSLLRSMQGVHVINSSELDQAVSAASFLTYHLSPHALLIYTFPLALILFLE